MAEPKKDDPLATLLGMRTANFGPLASAAEGYLDLANIPRYGMTEAERSQIIGLLPNSPPAGTAAGERYTSGAMFAKHNPALAGLVGPANAITDYMYGTNLRPEAERGVALGQDMYAKELAGKPALSDALDAAQSQRNVGAAAKRTGQTIPKELAEAILRGLIVR